MKLVLNSKFNIRSTRKEETEKYDYPVLTMYPKPDSAKAGYKFTLNQAAIDMLNTPKGVLITFNQEVEEGEYAKLDNPMLVNLAEGSKLNGNGNFFDKDMHEGMCSAFNIENTDEYEFKLQEFTAEGFSLATIHLMEATPVVDEVDELPPLEQVEEITYDPNIESATNF